VGGRCASKPRCSACSHGARASELTTVTVVSVVLGWNRREDTVRCLASLRAQEAPARHRIILVDNGSVDGTAQAAREAVPDIEVIDLERNLGFAPAANLGVERALQLGADYTWLVNNDTVAPADLLAELLAAIGGREDVGMVTPTVFTMDRPSVVWPSAGWRRPLTLAAFDTTARPPSCEPYDVDWATGCCLLVRAGLWRQIGLLDPRFAFYFEDHDLCLRARSMGWRILHVPRARVLHKVAGSTGQGSPMQSYLLARASVRYYWLHTRGAHRAFIVVYRLASFVRTVAAAVLDGRPRSAAATARGLSAGIWDLAANRQGPAAPR
jgi:hypothetical protein